jgi:hypothetical protein
VRAGRVGPRVDRRALGGQLPGLTGDRVGHEDLAGQGERGDANLRVGGVAHHAAALLATAFAAGPFLRRQLLVAPEERRRVGECGLLAGLGVQSPEEVLAVLARGGAQEQHPAPVGRDLEAAGGAEGEPLGAGLHAQE